MQFSRKTDYGLILLEALRPTYRSGAFRPVNAVARERNLPPAFLEKVAFALKQDGVLDARKGADGGYRFAKDPKTVTVADVVRVFEEPPMMRCLYSNHPEKYCALARTCPTRGAWHGMDKRINEVFQSVSIAEL